MKKELRLNYLFSAMLDDNLTEEEEIELNKTLEESPEARELYRHYIDTHFSLYELADCQNVTPEITQLPAPEKLSEVYRSLKWKLHIFQSLAACFAIFGVYLLLRFSPEPTHETIFAKVDSISPNAEFVGKSKKVGDLLGNEELILLKGEMSLSYIHGVEIKLVAPFHYSLTSLQLAHLKYGQLAAKVPDAAQGFTIESPRVVTVDLGTEFALNVTPEGRSSIFVHEGQVVSSLLKKDGTTILNADLLTAEGIEFNPQLETINSLSGKEKFIKIDERKIEPLTISKQYVEQVKKSAPFAYWRFEENSVPIIKNEMGDAYFGELTGKAKAINGKFVLEKKGDLGAFKVSQPLKEFNKNSYSIEFWVKAKECGNEMSLISIVAPLANPQQSRYNHLVYTQLMSNDNRFRCKPFDFRFSHRYPANVNYGKNVFAAETYIPGKWYHFVCTRDEEKIQLYLNGYLKSSVNEESNKDLNDYIFFMGQLDPLRKERQFYGEIAEVALYQRALSHEEIKNHFKLAKIE